MSEQDEPKTRRCFLREAGLAGACAALMPLLQACDTAEVLDEPLPEELAFNTNEAPYDQLKNTGDFVALADQPVILVLDGRGELLAFGSRCPHNDLEFTGPGEKRGSWDDTTRQLKCGHHFSRFSETGAVVNGPATQSIPRYQIEYDAATGAGKVFGRRFVLEA